MTESTKIFEKTWLRMRSHYQNVQPLRGFSKAYRRILARYYRFYVPEGSRVVEVGCGAGDLLSELKGYDCNGIDLCPEQLDAARKAEPSMTFEQGAAETCEIGGSYDYIILSDLLNEAADAQAIFENLRKTAREDTRIVMNVHNTLWRPVLSMAQKLRLKPKRPAQNWLSKQDVLNLADLGNWEVIRSESRILVPHSAFGIGTFLNKFIAPLVPWFCLSLFFVARPLRSTGNHSTPSVSIIIPARNEAGNIRAAIERTPEMGAWTEILFVEGNSQDDTWETIQSVIHEFPSRSIRSFQQAGKGKGDAMRLGYEKAKGDLIMILDADLTVPPEDLPKFYQAIVSGQADFANGVRLVYPMETEAMRFLNMCGNKFFSILFSWILGVPIKDTLCGTKVFSKAHYEKIAANRSYFGDFDPFGDFDLIFGAVKLNLKIRDIPIRYQSRTYGSPQIDRWRDGMLLIRMAAFATKKLKFF